jgi:hypothetical protein
MLVVPLGTTGNVTTGQQGYFRNLTGPIRDNTTCPDPQRRTAKPASVNRGKGQFIFAKLSTSDAE